MILCEGERMSAAEGGAIGTEVKVMMVTPELVGSQVCHVGPKLMEALSLRLGAPCRIICDDVNFVSHVWPRQDDSESHIQLDPVVCNEVTSQMHTSSCKIFVAPITPVKGHHLNVTVAVDSLSLTVRYKNQPSLQSKVKTYVQNIVRNLTLAPGYVVKSHLMELGQMYGIHTSSLMRLLVGKVSATSSRYSNVLVSPSTESWVGTGFCSNINAISQAHVLLE